MTIAGNISTLAQSVAQSNRLSDLRYTMDDLQRQVSSQKKYETYAGFGTDAFNLQRLRIKAPMAETYINNIDKTASTLEQMTGIMTKMSQVGNDFISAINLRANDANGIESLAELAQQNLNFIEELLNQKGIDGNYLFSGSDITNPPFIDANSLNSNMKNQVDQWLNGTITNQQMRDNTDAFTSVNLGLASGLDNAGSRTIRIGDNLDVEYGLKANNAGMQDLIRSLTLVANMKYPDAFDVATPDELADIFGHAATIANQGIKGINSESQKLASKFSLIKSVKENHQTDLQLFQKQIDTLENADPSQSLLQMQMLQTQLTASYQITKIMGDLSLTNFF